MDGGLGPIGRRVAEIDTEFASLKRWADRHGDPPVASTGYLARIVAERNALTSALEIDPAL